MQQASEIIDASVAADLAAFAAAHVGRWPNVSAFMDLLGSIHYNMGMPWWVAIIGVNLIVRGISIPITIFMQQKSGLTQQIKASADQVKAKYSEAAKASSPERYEELTRLARQEHNAMYSKFSKSDLRLVQTLPFIGLFNMVLVATQFVALTGLTAEMIPSMASGGLYWFTDLTKPDKYLALPILCTLASYAHLTSGGMQLETGSQMNSRTMQLTMKVFTFAFVPMGSYMPAALPMLWTCNTFIGVLQAQILRRPAVRERLGLPALPAKPAVPTAALSPAQGAAAEAAAVAAAKAAGKPPPPGQGPFRALHKPNVKQGVKPAQYVKPDRV